MKKRIEAMPDNRGRTLRPIRWAATLVLAVWLAPPAQAEDAKVYETPEAAAEALVGALKAGNREAILDVLGDEYKDSLFTDDETAERENRKLALAAATEAMTLQEGDGDTRTILIGKQQWPVPFPIVRTAKGWQFDAEAGLYELLARRIGANELAAISALRAYVKAQVEYAVADRDGDEVLEYAQRLASSNGKHDGLYWEVAEASNEAVSPLRSFVALQGGYFESRDAGDPLRGYYFRVLTRQGENAPGGRYDYVINGNMIAGYGLIAVPAEYGVTGVQTFVVSHQGKLYEKDLGEDTDLASAAIQEFNPDDSWQPAVK
ncbi:DUF2950 domain-containing protein [Dongia deserti]|uniref:DUF2950 domain-containing protein n=1 Tax=Dongia deserti TaxID=2268030 RepID=UPI000E657B26|nr:DUF2950 domain-containing protein [Dongia deserti]